MSLSLFVTSYPAIEQSHLPLRYWIERTIKAIEVIKQTASSVSIEFPLLSIPVTHSQSNQTKYELLDSNRLSINHSRRSSPPSKASRLAIEGDPPRPLTICSHEAPHSNILWTVSRSYLVSVPAVGPRGRHRAPRHLPARAIILCRSHRQQREFVMKVLLVNGSPKANGNTARALAEVAEQLNAEGIDTEVFQLGAKPIRDCIGCGQCGKLDCRCTFDDDMVNELIAAAEQADGFVFGSPVYYAHPSGRILSALDRAFYAGSKAFAHKPGAAVAVARRGGTSTTFDVLNKYFTINQMPVVASTYWNNVFGAMPGEAAQDAEGLATMRNIGKNMAWLLRCIEAGKAVGIEAPEADRARTNFIR